MKYVVRLVLLVGLLALGYWAWITFFPSPEIVIRKRLNKMAELASFNQNQGNITRIANLQRLGTYLTDEIEVIVEVPGVGNHTFNRREELMQAAAAARSTFSGLDAKFIDINVDLGPDKQSATAELTLRANIGNQKDVVVQELKFTLKKLDGDWLVSRIETVRTLK